jgi:ribosome-binding factor A
VSDQSIKGAQLADQIRDYLAAWTARDYPGSFVVITAVTLTPNLRHATVWVRIIGDEERTMQKLKRSTKHYQHRLKTTMPRFGIPLISFVSDTRAEGESDLPSILPS